MKRAKLGKLEVEELVALCLRGDERAISRLYERYCQGDGLIHWLVHNPRWGFGEDANDLVQEVFLALLNSLSSFRFEVALDNYAYAVVLRFCISELRKNRASKRRGNYQDFSPPAQRVSRENPPDILLEKRERAGILYQALQQLPQESQQLIRMRWYEELSPKEVSQRMGIPVKRVYAKERTALRRLRKLLPSPQTF